MIKRKNLPKGARITTGNDFNIIIKNGKCIKAENFKIYYINKQDAKSRIGIIVSKKIKVKAIKNKYKRMAREFFRINRSNFLRNIDMVIIVFKDKKEKTDQKITQMLKKEKIME